MLRNRVGPGNGIDHGRGQCVAPVTALGHTVVRLGDRGCAAHADDRQQRYKKPHGTPFATSTLPTGDPFNLAHNPRSCA